MAESETGHDVIIRPHDSSAGTFLLKRMIMTERFGKPFRAELYLLHDVRSSYGPR